MFLSELSSLEKRAFYSLALELIRSDGKIMEDEEILLSQFADEMSLDQISVSLIEQEQAFRVFDNSDLSVKKKVFLELFALAMSDEELEKEEIALLDRFSEHIHLSAQETDQIKKCVFRLTEVYRDIAQAVS